MIVRADKEMKYRDIEEIVHEFLIYRRHKHGKDPLD